LREKFHKGESILIGPWSVNEERQKDEGRRMKAEGRRMKDER